MSRPTHIDIIGQRFGRLVVTAFARVRHHRARWFCACDCGNNHEVYAHSLKSGDCRSCGCLNVEVAVKNLREAHKVPGIRRRTPRAVRDLEDAMRGWRA